MPPSRGAWRSTSPASSRQGAAASGQGFPRRAGPPAPSHLCKGLDPPAPLHQLRGPEKLSCIAEVGPCRLKPPSAQDSRCSIRWRSPRGRPPPPEQALAPARPVPTGVSPTHNAADARPQYARQARGLPEPHSATADRNDAAAARRLSTILQVDSRHPGRRHRPSPLSGHCAPNAFAFGGRRPTATSLPGARSLGSGPKQEFPSHGERGKRPASEGINRPCPPRERRVRAARPRPRTLPSVGPRANRDIRPEARLRPFPPRSGRRAVALPGAAPVSRQRLPARLSPPNPRARPGPPHAGSRASGRRGRPRQSAPVPRALGSAGRSRQMECFPRSGSKARLPRGLRRAQDRHHRRQDSPAH